MLSRTRMTKYEQSIADLKADKEASERRAEERMETMAKQFAQRFDQMERKFLNEGQRKSSRSPSTNSRMPTPRQDSSPDGRKASASKERSQAMSLDDPLSATSAGGSHQGRRGPCTATLVAVASLSSPSSAAPGSPSTSREEHLLRSDRHGVEPSMRGRKQDGVAQSPSMRSREISGVPVSVVPAMAIMRSTVPTFSDAQRRRAGMIQEGEVPVSKPPGPPGSPLLNQRRQILEVPVSPDRYNSFEPSARHTLGSAPTVRSGSSAAASSISCSVKPMPSSPMVLAQGSPVVQTVAATPVTKASPALPSRLGRLDGPGNNARSISPSGKGIQGKNAGLSGSYSHSALRSQKSPASQGSPGQASIRNLTPPSSYRMIARQPEYMNKSPR